MHACVYVYVYVTVVFRLTSLIPRASYVTKKRRKSRNFNI